MQIYVHRNNQQIGPFTEAEIKAQLASGAISSTDHAWWQGQAGWVPLSLTPFGGSAPVPAPGLPLPPGGPLDVGAPVPTSRLAIWALVLGCMSFFFSLLTSIPAIILGHMGMKETKNNPRLGGHGMAMAGMILGYIFTILLPIISIVAISVLIALGNQVKGTFKTIEAQEARNGADQSTTLPDQSTNSTTTPDSSTTNSADQSTNSAPTTTNAPDSSTNSESSDTNAPSSTTNAPSTNQ